MIPSIEQEIRDLHELLGSAQDPEGRAFVPLADAYRRAGDPDRALELLGRGLERHPDLAAGYLMQALACRDLADDEGAESAYRQVLNLDGDNARALVGLGRLIQGGDDDEEAERLIRRGVALDPRLASEGTPDRVPRHSTNPEVVGADSLAPLEWEVLDPPSDEAEVAAAPDAEPLAEAGVAGLPLDGGEAAAVAEADTVEGSMEPVFEATAEPVAEEGVAAIVEDVADPAAAEDEEPVAAEVVDPVAAEAAEPVALEEAEPSAAPVEPMVEDVDGAEVEPVATGPVEEPMLHEPAPAAEVVPLVDAEAALLRALDPVVDLDEPAGSEGAPEALDIEWEVEEFYQPISAPADEATPLAAPAPEAPAAEEGPALEVDQLIQALSGVDREEDPHGEDLVVDAWTLAPDGWSPGSEAPGGSPGVADAFGEGGEVPVDLSKLAPDAAPEPPPTADALDEPIDFDADDGDEAVGDEAVLPTRTLGELYAKQGLTTEALQVFRELAKADPTNLEYRARQLELEAELAGGSRRKAAVADEREAIDSADPDEPPISGFFDALLGWDSGNAAIEDT